MGRRLKPILAVGVVACIVASALWVLAQNASPPIPRLPDGKPDLSGVWVRRGGADAFFGPANGNAADQALKPEAREKYKKQLQAGKLGGLQRDLHDPAVLGCAPLGPTRIIEQGRPFEILNLPGRIFFLYEEDHWPRDVWMDGREHPQDMPPRWMGHSTGKWDGDTLVVDTAGLNDLTWIDNYGRPHSESLQIVERYTRVNYDTLRVQVTFEDPEFYSQPLVGNTLTFRLAPGGQIQEVVPCTRRIHLTMQEPDVCKLAGAWEYEAYCLGKEQSGGKTVPRRAVR